MGLSHGELPWFTESMGYLEGKGPGVFLSLSVRPERLLRELARKVQSDIALYQRRAHREFYRGQKRSPAARVLYLKVFEPLPSVGAHFVAVFPSYALAWKAVEAFNSSEYYAKFGARTLDARTIYDWPGLTTYLLKFSEPQAWWKARKSFMRVNGSHPLGLGGGDRVIPSPDLEAALLRSGKVEPRQRTNAKRTLPKRSRAMKACEAQLPLFPHLDKPVARLGEFVGGAAPPTVAMEIRFLCRRKGLTLTALGARTGQSRQRIGNFLDGRFGISPWGAQRLREALAA